MELYWLESKDHSEDWFVTAKSELDAIDFYACEMGYDIIDDELSARFVCTISSDEQIMYSEFASESLIKDCGGEIIFFLDPEIRKIYTEVQLALLGSETRIVKLNGEVFIEGHVGRTVANMLGYINKTDLN